MWQLSHPRDQWPRYLWRTIHAETQTIAHPWDPQQLKIIASAALDDLETFDVISSDQYPIYDALLIFVDSAADQHPVSSDLFTFLDMMTNHINWYSDSRTWFLSTFSDGGHAWNWAEQRRLQAQKRHYNDDVTVYKIDTTKLPPSVRLFDMETLDKLFQLKVKFEYKFAKDEVLVLGRIPEEAVVDILELGENGSASGRSPDDFFGGNGGRLGSFLDEDLDDRQVSIRAEVLGAAEDGIYQNWVTVRDGCGRSDQLFWVPVAVARQFGYSETSDDEESVGEEGEEVEEVVDEDEDEDGEEEEEEEEVLVKVEVVEVWVEDGVKGKDNHKVGEGKGKEVEDKEEVEDEMAHLIDRLAIFT